MRRLEERYGVPREKSFDLYFEHLAHILAGEGDVRAWWSHGAQLILLPMEDKDYWVIYRPDMSRIVTYLPLHPRLPKLRGMLRTSIINALRVRNPKL